MISAERDFELDVQSLMRGFGYSRKEAEKIVTQVNLDSKRPEWRSRRDLDKLTPRKGG